MPPRTRSTNGTRPSGSRARLGEDGTEYEALNESDVRKLTSGQLGTAFDITHRLFPNYAGGAVFDYGHADVANINDMLSKDGKARGLEQVLTLPLRGTTHEILGDRSEWVKERIPNLNLLIDQMTSGCVYRKAFFEKEWDYDREDVGETPNGAVKYKGIHFRPAIGCSAAYHPTTAEVIGFRQRVYNLGLGFGGGNAVTRKQSEIGRPRKRTRTKLTVTGTEPGLDDTGHVFIPHSRAFVYVHGLHREPLLGLSDLEIAYWAYETRQKIVFLWFQFLENQSIPSRVVFGEDQTSAEVNADAMRELRASGVMGMRYPPEGQRAFEVLDSAGQGAAQFQQAIQYLDSMMMQSVLAGFMELPSAAAQGTGSYALSADQSEFFLVSRQGVADEMGQALTRRVVEPLIRYNFGSEAQVPKVKIGPLSGIETQRALDMLTAIVSAPELNVPMDFVGALVKQTATYLGLDEDEIEQQITGFIERRGEQQEREAELDVQEREASIQEVKDRAKAAAQNGPTGGRGGSTAPGPRRPPNGPQPSPRAPGTGKPRAPRGIMATHRDGHTGMKDVTDAVYELVSLVNEGYDPQDLVKARVGKGKNPTTFELRFSPLDHPRWPKGSERGGEFRGKGSLKLETRRPFGGKSRSPRIPKMGENRDEAIPLEQMVLFDVPTLDWRKANFAKDQKRRDLRGSMQENLGIFISGGDITPSGTGAIVRDLEELIPLMPGNWGNATDVNVLVGALVRKARELDKLANLPENRKQVEQLQRMDELGGMIVRDMDDVFGIEPPRPLTPSELPFSDDDFGSQRSLPRPLRLSEFVEMRRRQRDGVQAPNDEAPNDEAPKPSLLPATPQQLRSYASSGGRASDLADIRRLAGGAIGDTRLVNIPGTDGVAVFKYSNDVHDSDAEELSSLVGKAVGANVPVVTRLNEKSVLMQFVPGGIAYEYEGDQQDVIEAHPQLGMLDFLISNSDRHDGNWMIDDYGNATGIDHGFAFKGWRDRWPPAGAFATAERPDVAYVEVVRIRLEALKPEFDRLDRTDWYRGMMSRLDSLVEEPEVERAPAYVRFSDSIPVKVVRKGKPLPRADDIDSMG